MSPEVIPVGLLEDTDGRLVSFHQRDELIEVGETVRAIRKHDGALREPGEHAVEGLNRRTTIAKRGEPLCDFLDLGPMVDRQALPITRETFNKMVALDVTIVIRPRYV